MRVLVTGAGGMLGREAVRMLGERGHDPLALDRRALDITDAAAVYRILSAQRPDAVLHCAAFTNVDAAESDPEGAMRVNVHGTGNVARAAARTGARFLYVSTDYVFDGVIDRPYRPDDATNPLGTYGRTKLEGEEAARSAGGAIIARTSWVYGKGGTNFASSMLDRARAGEPVKAIADQRSVPTWVRDTADVMITLLERNAPAGVYHTNNAGAASWYEFAVAAFELAGMGVLPEPVSVDDMNLPAPRPRYSAMDVGATESVVGPIRGWREALEAAVEEGL